MSERNQKDQTTSAGWIIRQSIILELGAALTFTGRSLFGSAAEDRFPPIPAEWLEQWQQMIGDAREEVSLLEYVALMAGVLLEDDYEKATLAMRELKLPDALAAIEQLAANYHLVAQEYLSLEERVVDLTTRCYQAVYADFGFITVESQLNRVGREVAQAMRILSNGDLHTRFWFWLDRFYFEMYRPWRLAHIETLERLQQRALTVLGKTEQYGTPPDLSWLPEQNPASRLLELHTAIEEGKVLVCFWVEPFALSDFITLTPGMVILPISEPGPWFEQFFVFKDELARRVHALGDPTRLMILRLIRHYSMVNSEIANYLQLARPTVSIHVKILRDAGLIRSHTEGRLTRHEIVPSEVHRLIRDLGRFLDLPPEEGA